MKKLAITLLVVAALVVAAALALPSFLDVNRYRGAIQSQLQASLNRRVTLGPMRLSYVPLALRVENAAIAEDAAFGEGKIFAHVDELYVSASFWPLLQGELEIDSLELRRPRLELIRNAAGVWNFSSLGQPPAAAPPAAAAQTPPPAPQAAPKSRVLVLQSLRIRDGMVAVTDLEKKQARTVYNHIDVVLDDYAPGKAFSLEVAARLPGEGEPEVQLAGRAGPLAEGDFSAIPFDGAIKLRSVPLSSLAAYLKSEALRALDATATGETQLKLREGQLAAAGSLRLEQPRVRGVALGYTLAAAYDLRRERPEDPLRIEKGDLRLGATPVSITGSVNPNAVPATVDLRIQAGDVALEEAARLAAALGVVSTPSVKVAGRLSADVAAQGAAAQPALRGSLSVRDLAMTGSGLPQPVRVDALQLALSPQSIHAGPFAASSGGSRVQVEFSLSQYTSSQPMLDASLSTRDAEIGEVLAMAHAWGIDMVKGISGSGRLALQVRTTGPLKQAAARSYSGEGSVQRAVLNLPALAKPLRLDQAQLRFTRNSVEVDSLSAALGGTSATGNLRLRDFAAPRLEFNLTADTINLSEWQQILSGGAVAARAAPDRWRLVPQANAQAREPSFFSRMTGRGSLLASTVIYDKLRMSNARATVTLEQGIIRLEPLESEVYGGKQRGSIVMDTRTTPATYSVTSRMERVDANQMLTAVSSVRDKIFGLLAANGDTSFTATAGGDLARTLNGKMALDMRDGKIANMDLLYEIASAARFLAAGQKMKPFTDVAQLAGDIELRQGVAHTRNLKAVISEGNLAVEGTASLVDQSLNLRVTAVLSKSFSEDVGGTRVGGFMTTALANRNGELVVPLRVTGTFEKPRFAPDLEKIAKMKLENLVPSLSSPGGLADILGALGGKSQPAKETKDSAESSDPAAQKEPAAKPANPLEDILGAVLGGQKKKPAPAAPQPAPDSKAPADEKPPEQPK